MAYINYIPEKNIDQADRVLDLDNILRIHGIHSRVMQQHYELYRELMRGSGTLGKVQREMIAVVVSSENSCHY